MADGGGRNDEGGRGGGGTGGGGGNRSRSPPAADHGGGSRVSGFSHGPWDRDATFGDGINSEALVERLDDQESCRGTCTVVGAGGQQHQWRDPSSTCSCGWEGWAVGTMWGMRKEADGVFPLSVVVAMVFIHCV